MTDLDIDAVLETEPDGRKSVAPATMGIAAMEQLADRLRRALANLGGFDLVTANPEQRQQLVDFRDFLLDTKEPISLWLNRIDAMFRDAGERVGARQFPLLDGRTVTLDEPPTTYQVQEQQLRSALLALVRDGFLTQDDVDKAIQPTTIYRVDNRVLNTLARNRGTAVADAIAKFRSKVESTASQARVVYPRRPS